jgi:hypothetical protein
VDAPQHRDADRQVICPASPNLHEGSLTHPPNTLTKAHRAAQKNLV